MTVATNFLVEVLCIATTILFILLFVRVILSWAELLGFRRPYSGPLRTALDLLDDVTDPVLRPLRALIPPLRAGTVGLDLSVLIAFVILFVLRSALHC